MPYGLVLSFLSSHIPLCVIPFLLSPGHTFLAFLPCPFACGILLLAMIHYSPLMDYLWVGNDEIWWWNLRVVPLCRCHKWTYLWHWWLLELLVELVMLNWRICRLAWWQYLWWWVLLLAMLRTCL